MQETHLVIKMNAVAAQAEPHASFVGLVLTPARRGRLGARGRLAASTVSTTANALTRTSDAAYVEHLVPSDRLPPEAAKNHRKSKLLVNVLGNSRKEPFVTVGHHEPAWRRATCFLLCSDGLWHFFTDAELGAATAQDHAAPGVRDADQQGRRALPGQGRQLQHGHRQAGASRRRTRRHYTVQKMGRAV